MDWETFGNNLREILRLKRHSRFEYISWDFDDEKLEIKFFLEEEKVIYFTYTKKEFLIDSKNMVEENELCISNEKYYEIPISIENRYSPIMPGYLREKSKEFKDNDNNIKYVIGNPSEQFWLKIVKLKIKPNIMMIWRRLSFLERDVKFEEGIKKRSIFDLLKIIYREYITLKIFSMDEYKKAYFQQLADSLIFNINYNTDVGMRQIYEFENMHEERIDNRFRDDSINDISTPRRIYKKELVEQYNTANISEEPFIKYLCYYHILEHFYETVYKEDLIQTVKGQLTLPNFSIKKEKEIIKLIDIIKDKVKYDREGFDGNELEALELVIKKYVNIKDIKSKIKDINVELVDYYDTQKVKFSKGIPINFNDLDNIQKNVAKRIYFTRNALVHYKSNDFSEREKGIYRPFSDKEELIKEIPLIRILAEEVIINSSEMI